MLERDQTALVVIDVQEKLAPAMHQREAVLDQISRALRGAQALGLPTFLTEQVPASLGPTLPEIRELHQGPAPLVKNTFSCCGSDAFVTALRDAGRSQVLVAGIESHVCVYQTVADLIREGFQVEVLQDAISSRTERNARLGLERCREAGAAVSSVEMALFELLRVAEGDAFRSVIQIVK
jgi:nicotinamidase-related amidase